MVVNYVGTLMMMEQGASVEETMQQMIDQFGKLNALIIALVPLVIGFFVVIFWGLVVNQQSFTEMTTSRKKIDWKRILFMFAFWGAISAVMIFLTAYTTPETMQYNLDWDKFLPLLLVALLMLPLQTSFEEYLFRSQLMQGLGIATKTRWIPLIVTAILFGLMHSANPEVEKLGMGVMIFYIGTGLLLGIMTLMDEGLELALGFHAANNIVAALLVTSSWTALQTDSVYIDIAEPSFGIVDILPIVIGYPVILFILGKIYKWNNWTERLFGKVMSKEEFQTLEETTTN
jgi:hypothetical protein